MRSLVLAGVSADVVTPQSEAAQRAHDLAHRYDPHAERLFTAAQVFTASFASLAHGSNDVANAIAPLSVIQWVFFNGGAAVTSAMPTPLSCTEKASARRPCGAGAGPTVNVTSPVSVNLTALPSRFRRI